MLSFCLIFSQFQLDVAYKSVAYIREACMYASMYFAVNKDIMAINIPMKFIIAQVMMDRQTDRQAGKQVDRQIDRQIDRDSLQIDCFLCNRLIGTYSHVDIQLLVQIFNLVAFDQGRQQLVTSHSNTRATAQNIEYPGLTFKILTM